MWIFSRPKDTLEQMRNKKLTLSFGYIIRQLRLQAGLSQEGLAELCQLHRTYIGFIERGEKTVTIDTAHRLADALNISLSKLFDQVEQHKKSVEVTEAESEEE